jgi:hypothetical protein
MGQLGFFDLNRRYESLTEKNDPLVAIAAVVPFESFRPKLNAALIKGGFAGAKRNARIRRDASLGMKS